MIRYLLLSVLSLFMLMGPVQAKQVKIKRAPVLENLTQYMKYHCRAGCVSEGDLLTSVMSTASMLNIDFKDLLAIVKVESNFKPKAKSGKNRGLMQVNVRYHQDKLKGKDVYDVATNISVGGMIYKDCLDKTKGEKRNALKCYNGSSKKSLYAVKVLSTIKEISKFQVVQAPLNAEEPLPMKERNDMSITINMYCNGGTGMNLGKVYAKFSNQERPGFATINTIFIDTSDSNLDERVPSDKFFRIEGVDEREVDGSGKKRDTNYDAIEAAINPILNRFPPADINVLMNSTGGGSGSVIGPLLLAELLARGEKVISVVVGITSCRQEVLNTKNTMLSYENIAAESELPVNVFYRDNAGRSRQDVDRQVHTFLAGLSVMLSGQNRELDKEDYNNTLNYHRVTNYTPQLTFIDLFSKEVTLDKGQSLVSLLTVVDSEEDSTESNVPTEYQAAGFIHPAARNSFKAAGPIHLAVIAGYFNPVISDLDKRLKNFDETRNLNPSRSIIKNPVQATRKGLVL